MAFADPVLAEIERKLDSGVPLSMDEGAQKRQEGLLRSQSLHQLDQRLLCRLHVLLVCSR
jgi:hypothetical protein